MPALTKSEARSLLKKIAITAGLQAYCSNIWHNRPMQGFERADRQVLDAGVLAGAPDP